MSRDFEIIQLEIEEAALQRVDNRLRNQLMGCMHAHNELAVLNRIFMFVLNDTGAGELHDSANSVYCGTVLRQLAALAQAAKGRAATGVGSIASRDMVCSSLTLAGVLYPCRATSQVSL